MAGQHKQIVIKKIITETKDAKTFILSTTDGSILNYKAGQFLTFIFDEPSGQQRRNYSISSSPVLDEPISITIKRIPNGLFSRLMVGKAREGDLLTTIGANGFFTLPREIDRYKQLFLIAVGSGITPVYSLLKTALHLYPRIQVTLIYSNHFPSDAIFYQSLHQLQSMYKGQLKIEWLFSSANDYTRARLGNWLLGELLKKYRIAPVAECLFYICGPLSYMRTMTITLLSAGVHLSQIRKEEFTIHKPAFDLVPPDIAPRKITVTLDGKKYNFASAYPNSILQSAKKQEIEFPYSCEAGRCGACAAVCLRGKVWMKYNEVLTEDDIRIGRVLTCTGYQVGGDVELDFDKTRVSL